MSIEHSNYEQYRVNEYDTLHYPSTPLQNNLY